MRTWERLKHRHDHCTLSSFTTEKTEADILMGGRVSYLYPKRATKLDADDMLTSQTTQVRRVNVI